MKGDRVVLPFNVSCGTCFNCSRGFTNACLLANDEAAGAAYGYVDMGPYRGGQAELLRVPWAEANCIKLPGEPGDDLEDDFLLLSDIPVPWGELWEKGIQIGTGQTPVRHYSLLLRDLIIAGRAKPSFIVSRRIPLDEAPDAYAKFNRREPGYTKVLVKPGPLASVAH